MKMTKFPTRLVIPALLAAALPLAAQTSSKPTSAATEHRTATASRCADPAPEVSAKVPALPASTPCVKALYTVTRLAESRLDYVSPLVSPEVRHELGEGAQTFSLDYVDTKVGTGALVEPHKCLSVQYTGYLASDGTKFDSSKDHPGAEPISFPYGVHSVIPGWDTGFEGMRTGGERRIFIPYQLAYGEAGRPPRIPERSMLIFDVALVDQFEPRAGVPMNAACMKNPPPPPVRPGMAPGRPGGSPPPPGGTAAPGSTPPASTPPPAKTPPPASGGTTPPPSGSSNPQ
jgi:peptidylprolyl isomerase